MSLQPRHALVRAAWTLAIALAAVVVVKMFVCDVKHVDSGSMAPTILGSPENGESVLVLHGEFEPERFDYVVIALEGESLPIVKRVAGLPTESVRIDGGDLRIDGKRLPLSAPRPAPIVVFDDRLERVADAFEVPSGADGPWSETPGGFLLDSTGSMSLRRRLSDGYLGSDGVYVAGVEDVHDAILECEILFSEAGGRAVVELVEQGDVFRFVLEPKSSGTAEASIARRGGGEPEVVLAKRVVPFAAGGWTKLRCSNVDDGLALEVSSTPEVLCAEYAENRFDPADRLRDGRTFGPRVRLGGEEARLVFRSIRVLRDVHYTARDVHGVQAPADLGPDEIFVLGDNSSESRDSREWGPVRRSQILGRPVWVVWPPAHARKLVATVLPPCGR